MQQIKMIYQGMAGCQAPSEMKVHMSALQLTKPKDGEPDSGAWCDQGPVFPL